MKSTIQVESRLVYSRDEARRLANLGHNAFDEAVRRGDFPSVRVGRRVLIPRAAFERILSGEAGKN